MEEQHASEWWLWQMYRSVANFVNSPTDTNAAALHALINTYRAYRAAPVQSRPQSGTSRVHDSALG